MQPAEQTCAPVPGTPGGTSIEVRRDAASTDAATRQELCAKTRDQIALSRMSEPLTREQLCRALWGTPAPPVDEKGDHLCPLASMRFGTWQNGKLRPIENCRKSGVNDDLRLLGDARVEKDESHPGKVVERRWYDRNKHIFPASRWEIYDPSVTFDKYTIHGGEIMSKK